MEIAFIAGDRKKEMMTQFCIAFSGILSKHNLFATGTTGKCISEATDLNITCMPSCTQGGIQQLSSKVSYEELDFVVFFRDSYESETMRERSELELLKLCDVHNIPVAMNPATAEILLNAIERGEFEWRKQINPVYGYVKSKRPAK